MQVMQHDSRQAMHESTMDQPLWHLHVRLTWTPAQLSCLLAEKLRRSVAQGHKTMDRPISNHAGHTILTISTLFLLQTELVITGHKSSMGVT